MIVWYRNEENDVCEADCTNKSTLLRFERNREALMRAILTEGLFLDSPEGIWIPPHRILKIDL